MLEPARTPNAAAPSSSDRSIECLPHRPHPPQEATLPALRRTHPHNRGGSKCNESWGSAFSCCSASFRAHCWRRELASRTAVLARATVGRQSRQGTRVLHQDARVRTHRASRRPQVRALEYECSWSRIRASTKSPIPRGTGGLVLNISVADVATARKVLEGRGVVFDGPTVVIPGKVSLAGFKDPDGNRLRLAGPPPPK